jgi:uncharacterized protein DUF1840
VLVRFDSKAGTLTTFGEVAVKLLKLMGQSGAVPGAILARDIPAAVARLRQGVGQEPQAREENDANDADPPVNLSQRAFPLIELLERAAKIGADVIWEEERKRFST